MKPPLEKSVNSNINSFVVQYLDEPHFDPHWHFHPHYQLFTVLEGHGTRFIGDSIKHFDAGDTVFLGPNLPHLWQSDKAFFEPNSKLRAKGIVVYFSMDFLGKEFFEKQEMLSIKLFLEQSLRGFQIEKPQSERIKGQLQKLHQLQGFEAIIFLLSMLHQLAAENTEPNYITGPAYINTHKITETERMQKVYEYLFKNFKEEIKLSDIASEVSMSESAFCRYFKGRTNKTLTVYVAEIRIGHACKMLVNSDFSIQQIALDSGYNTLSNFNRFFKLFTKMTPLEYQKSMKGQKNKRLL